MNALLNINDTICDDNFVLDFELSEKLYRAGLSNELCSYTKEKAPMVIEYIPTR